MSAIRRVIIDGKTPEDTLYELDRVVIIRELYRYCGEGVRVPKGSKGTAIFTESGLPRIWLDNKTQLHLVWSWYRKLSPLEQLADAAE